MSSNNGAKTANAPADEPIAIVGMSGLYPGATTLEALHRAFERGACSVGDVPEARWHHADYYDPDPAAEDCSTSRLGAFLDEVPVSLARYKIPPAHATSIARAQLLFLEAVDRCLEDAGYGTRPFDRDRTDVICATCFGFDRTYANAMRAEAARFIARYVEALDGVSAPLAPDTAGDIAADLRERFRRRLGGAAHDRIGEMASTIPARISVAYRLRGRSLAVESADASSFVALRIALDTLRQRAADQVILAAGQVLDGPLAHVAFSKKGVLAPGPAAPLAKHGAGYNLGEGVGALLIKRLSDAVRDRDRIYCLIRGLGLRHTSRRGSFRYGGSVGDRVDAVTDACREAACDPASIQYVECVASGIPAETELELASLSAALSTGQVPRREVFLGSVRGNFGNTFANAGLAAITRVALALHRGVLFPQAQLRAPDTIDLSHTPFTVVTESRAWPVNAVNAPRRAGVNGAGMTGTICHAVLEEYVPGASAAIASLDVQPGRSDTPIAVVGLGGRFARAGDAAALWRNICERVDAVGPLPDSVVERAVYYDPDSLDPFKTYSILGSKLDAPELPLEEFRVVPRRLLYMDDAQKLALAVAREMFASYGCPRRPLPNRRAAVVFGTSLALRRERSASNRLGYRLLEDVLAESASFAGLSRIAQRQVLDRLRRTARDATPPLSSWSLDGYLASGIAAVISNELELNAVPIAVEAACASSMGALDVAMRSLVERRYDFAIAGGVDLPANAADLMLCSSLRLLSAGRIKPFDERADGINVGEGIAMFGLMRLEDARAQGCRIYAVLRGMGASSDARSLIAPDAGGQELALRRAFEAVDFAPDTVQYIETHGTGTRAGDRAEAQAIASVYSNHGRSSALALGSIKSMLGHTFAAAGAAGLLKTVLALGHQIIPPNLFADRVNPELELERIPAYVATEPQRWQSQADAPRRAAVSSMGTGGINFHLLVEESPHDSPERS